MPLAGWLPRTGISSGTLRSVIEYGIPLPFLYYINVAGNIAVFSISVNRASLYLLISKQAVVVDKKNPQLGAWRFRRHTHTHTHTRWRQCTRFAWGAVRFINTHSLTLSFLFTGICYCGRTPGRRRLTRRCKFILYPQRFGLVMSRV